MEDQTRFGDSANIFQFFVPVAEDTMAANIANRRKFMRIAGLVVFMFVMASVYAQQPLSDEKQILKSEDDWGASFEDER
jgi:hypothetical protein